MPDKNSAIDEFLGGLNGDQTLDNPNQNPFEHFEETPQEEPVSEEPVEKEEKLPFHRDPKIQRYIQKEIAKATKDLTPREQARFEEERGDDDDLVGAFETIIGNDTPEKQHALKMLGITIRGLKEEATSATRALQNERMAEQQAEEQLYEGFETIEEEFDIDITSKSPQARKTKAEFIEFIEAIAPKDEYGEITEYPDFTKSFEIFQSLKAKTPPASRAKELASRSMARASDASTIPEPQGFSWKDVDKHFSKLQG